MYIVIVGGGQVGYYLTRALLIEGHEVLVIEKDTALVSTIEDELGSVCVQGDGCEISVLREAGVERADLFIAVTSRDEDNLVACQVAKHKFNVPRTIARVSNPQNETLFNKLGIDITVSSVKLILEHIEEEIPIRPLTHLLALQDSQANIIGMKIPSASSAVGKQIKDIPLPQGSIVLLIIHKEAELVVPTADTTIQAEDRLIAVANTDQEEAFLAALTSS